MCHFVYPTNCLWWIWQLFFFLVDNPPLYWVKPRKSRWPYSPSHVMSTYPIRRWQRLREHLPGGESSLSLWLAINTRLIVDNCEGKARSEFLILPEMPLIFPHPPLDWRLLRMASRGKIVKVRLIHMVILWFALFSLERPLPRPLTLFFGLALAACLAYFRESLVISW